MSMSFISGSQGYYPGVWLPPMEDEGPGGGMAASQGYPSQVGQGGNYGGRQGSPAQYGYGSGRGRRRGSHTGYGNGSHPSQNYGNPYGEQSGGYQPPAFRSQHYCNMANHHPDQRYFAGHGNPQNPYLLPGMQSAYTAPQSYYSPTIVPNHYNQQQPLAWNNHPAAGPYSSRTSHYSPSASPHGDLSGAEWAGQVGYRGMDYNDERGTPRERGRGGRGEIRGSNRGFRSAESTPGRTHHDGRLQAGQGTARNDNGGNGYQGSSEQAQTNIGLGIAREQAEDGAKQAERDGTPAKLERKQYHPAPPLNRSDWVMWVGNVPGNASHEEMWKFFTTPMHPADIPFEHVSRTWVGVASIFLISRSSCAFVNLRSEEDLALAIAYFNGRTIRPWDSRCPPLVCRIRKTDDDLRAGVGGQRGAGLHTRYVRDLKEKERDAKPETPSNGDPAQKPGAPETIDKAVPAKESLRLDLTAVKPDPKLIGANSEALGAFSPTSPSVQKAPPEGDGRRRESVMDLPGGITPAAFAAWAHDRTGSGNHSFASTNSSLLARHFPKRYFIMKSSNTEDLERSVKMGYWATQAHNEPILDQAFRTSPEVVLVFGANKQGGFFGYALMRSAIKPDNRQPRSVSQSSNVVLTATPGESISGSGSSEGPLSLRSGQRAVLSTPSQPDIAEEGSPPEWGVRPPFVHAVSSEQRLAAASPPAMTPGEETKFPPPVYHQSVSPLVIGKGASEPQPAVARKGSTPGYRPQTLDPKDLARIRQKIQVAEIQKEAGARFELDSEAPVKARRGDGVEEPLDVEEGKAGSDGVVRKDMLAEADLQKAEPEETTPSVVEVRSGDALDADGKNAIGTPFKIEWIKVGTLPFHRIKHLRNPWNQDKEVKISRDGTEISPDIAPALLAEWDKMGDPQAPAASPAPEPKVDRGPFDLSQMATAVNA